MASMTTYSASVALHNKRRDAQGRGTEHGHEVVYVAPSNREAVLAAKRFADRMVEQWPDEYTQVNCIKVSVMHPKEIDAKGYISPACCGPFFEWKCDYPGEFGWVDSRCGVS